jgi:hypothetical protein|tara:strand:+ start:327 stop:545 length:219 start_codon:yes stop_codon:yes gene_type:complete
VASNNIDSMLYRTVLKVQLGLLDGEVVGFKYDTDKGLQVRVDQSESLITVDDIIDYSPVSEADGWATIAIYQ